MDGREGGREVQQWYSDGIGVGIAMMRPVNMLSQKRIEAGHID
jgi:hypothetical protein